MSNLFVQNNECNLTAIFRLITLAFLSVCIIFGAVPRNAEAALITKGQISNGSGLILDIVTIDGEIISTDLSRLRKILRENPSVRIVKLNSPGGEIFPAMGIGRLLRKEGMHTYAGEFCVSACALIWLAGQDKFLLHTTSLGFHAAWINEWEVASVGNALVGAYVNELGYTNNVVEYVTTAPPKEMEYLDSEKARLLGLDVLALSTENQLADYLGTRTDQIETKLPKKLNPPTEPDIVLAPRADDNNSDISEDEFWEEAVVSGDVKVLKTYIELFPSGKYVQEALELIEHVGTREDRSKSRWFFAGYKDLDFWGADIRAQGVVADSFEGCALWCSEELECKAFTYNPKNERCYVKSFVDIAIKTPGVVSGLVFESNINEGEPPPEPKIIAEFSAIPAVEYTGFRRPWWQPPANINSMDACVRYCRSDAECSFISVMKDGRGALKCNLWRHRVTGMRNVTGAMSFRKIQDRLSPSTQIIELKADDGTSAQNGSPD